MENEIKINILELASDLADRDIELFYKYSDIYDDSDAEVVRHTEYGQEVFDELYDKYYGIILSCKV